MPNQPKLCGQEGWASLDGRHLIRLVCDYSMRHHRVRHRTKLNDCIEIKWEGLPGGRQAVID